ncbi:hypothetical protein AGR7C_pAt0162 [Agrobacterium deltaense Zutra 3/1]|uniref:Uncharacterized protein n=1 Tax=Agrobacterium deltaense Zutra 3/1 TaxID=1183427 RepID=A0A1S7S3N1_9HYPH|nr:hypothetical protein AGR7C_pAt0162 [Agrobacterium deltaense Zutra 3/1]
MQQPIEDILLEIKEMSAVIASINPDFPYVSRLPEKSSKERDLGMALLHQLGVQAQGGPNALSPLGKLCCLWKCLWCIGHGEQIGSRSFDVVRHLFRRGKQIQVAVKVDHTGNPWPFK